MPSEWGSRGQEVYTVGLTGGIASGKSEVCKELRNLGAYVIDADEVARDVVKPGLPAYKQILSVFGPQVLEDSGKIDREALGKLVFLDPRKRTLLNRITHPCIAEEITRRLVDFAEGNEQLRPWLGLYLIFPLTCHQLASHSQYEAPQQIYRLGQ